MLVHSGCMQCSRLPLAFWIVAWKALDLECSLLRVGNLPAVCTWHAKQHREGVTSPAPLKAKVEREIRNNYQFWRWEGCRGLLLSFPMAVLLVSLMSPHVVNPMLPSEECWLQAPSRAHWRNLGHSEKVVRNDPAPACCISTELCPPGQGRCWAGPESCSWTWLTQPSAASGLLVWWLRSGNAGTPCWGHRENTLWHLSPTFLGWWRPWLRLVQGIPVRQYPPALQRGCWRIRWLLVGQWRPPREREDFLHWGWVDCDRELICMAVS